MSSKKDRAKGALMGAFIGEALGVGPHWYYDLEEQRAEYGEWIDDYTLPKANRYHDGLKPGELSQQGWIIQLMAEFLIENGEYDETLFCKMIDEKVLPHLDGTPMGGKGGYTSQVMRHLFHTRVELGLPWDQVASIADTSESLERNIPNAIFYADDLETLSKVVARNTALTQSDNVTGSLSVAFNLVLAMLINGEPLDESISIKLMKKVHKGELPFHAVTSSNLSAPKKGEQAKSNEGLFASPDALLSPGYMAKAALDKDIQIEPAWKVSIVYGMPCAIYHMLPAAYYLGARFADDFEAGVLNALNGGGQNQVRAMLTGALIGAQVGFSKIPKRFVDGLKDKEHLLEVADKLSDNFLRSKKSRS
ncbi:MAG: ADP-ribosylglycohydrolase family protein [Bacillota bacterium]|nr:ADP-ribosylglycohydrolase family protein [Bacillota bacterium]